VLGDLFFSLSLNRPTSRSSFTSHPPALVISLLARI